MTRLLFLLAFIPMLTFAQTNTQNIRGEITDKYSQIPLIGVTIEIVSLQKGTSSDTLGKYTLSDITPGRYELSLSYVGYKKITVPNVVVTAGKEIMLDVAMEEDFYALKELTIVDHNKEGTINQLASVSARTFSMEEVNRFAGGRSDPARLAANFAGVSAPDDSRNDIAIRGNSPVGVLWRIDGMNVTNPNHFASVGTTGGAVSALNTNLLKNSDFFTSAFPAEYGNATSGVFDLGLRHGNNQKRETTLQAGVITGLEVTTEGPFSSKKESSYLVGYRYSLAGVAQAFGIDIGTTATPTYQDLSFKINGGNQRIGKISLFGILATSTINIGGGPDNSLYGGGNQVDFASKIGIGGVSHNKQLTKKSYLLTTAGINFSSTDQTGYNYDRKVDSSFVKETSNASKTTYFIGSSYNLKINSQVFLKVGIQSESIGLDLYYKTKENILASEKLIWDERNSSLLMQGYAHLKFNVSNQFSMNIGVHSNYYQLNQSRSIEPRLGLVMNISPRSSIQLGYGLHSQMQPINVYFLKSTDIYGTADYNNKNLDFTKSHHVVLGYNLQPFKDWRIKSEIYYQSIYQVPVNTYNSSYSMLNTGSTFKTDLTDSLENMGTGKNYGFELTLEKFFSHGYYTLLTASIYESKYIGSDGIEHNTAFNGQYVCNILGGKEWKIGANKNNTFSMDLKYTNAGGRSYTPIDLEASNLAGHEVLSAEVYSKQYENYSRLDFKIGLTKNSSQQRVAQTFLLDLQNVTNHKNIFSQSYNQKNNSIDTTYQLGFFPNVVYKIQF